MIRCGRGQREVKREGTLLSVKANSTRDEGLTFEDDKRILCICYVALECRLCLDCHHGGQGI